MNFMASRQGFYEDDTRGGSLRPFSSHSSSSSSSSSSTTTATASASASASQHKGGLTSVPMSYHLNLHHQTRRGWDESPTTTSNNTNFRYSRQLQGGVSHLDLMMDSSPTNNGDDVDDSDEHLLTRQGGGGGGELIVNSTETQGPGSCSGSAMIEREHMFDKVVTPSDVGKLNRLVIPKQHAEKYFPLDSSTNEKGLLLNFEDRNGKPWRFRYSYWNSSQSYVMTKGWSRFVKEKKLDAGDIVSFQRGVGESVKDRLFIDWRRRPDAPDQHLHHFHRQHQHLYPSVSSYSSLPHHHFSFHPWSHPPYYLQHQQAQATLPVPLRETCHNFLQVNNHHSHSHSHHLNNNNYTYGSTYGNTSSVMNGNPCPSSVLYLRSANVAPTSQQVGIGIVQLQTTTTTTTGGSGGMEEPMVYESVPVVQGKATTAKRFRLFGVNMECPISGSDDINILSSTAVPNSSMAPQQHSHFSSPSPPPSSSSSSCSNINTSCQLRPYSGTPVLQTMSSDIFNNNNNNNNKGKTSMSLDFDV